MALYSLSKGARLPFAAAIALLLLSHRLWKGIDFAGKPEVLRSPERRNEEPYPADIYPGGKDLDTPYGRIRYFQFGPADGKKLMLVHGISTPAPAWRKLVPLLVKAGYRLLIFDLFGRGYSDTPVVPHDVALKVSQIALVLADLPDWDKFDLCGMSLGGPIASNFAYYFPNRIDRLVLLCPAGGLSRNQLPLARRVVLSSLIPQRLFALLIYLLPIRPTGDLGDWQVKNHKGFVYSFTSSLRHGPVFSNAHVHQHVVKSFGPRVCAVWGDDDTIVPMSTSKYFGDLDVRVVPRGGHWIILTHPEEVARHMLEFLGTKA